MYNMQYRRIIITGGRGRCRAEEDIRWTGIMNKWIAGEQDAGEKCKLPQEEGEGG